MEIETAIQSLGALSYGGMFLFALTVNFIIPIPEEIILVLLGYIASTGAFQIIIIAPILIGGMLTSDMVLFGASYYGSKHLKRFTEKIKNNRLLQDETFVQKHIKKIIFISRFVVQFRFIGPVLSGSMKIKWQTFLLYDLFALCIYVPAWLFLGDYFHGRIRTIIEGVGVFRNILFIVLVCIAATILSRFITKKFIQGITKQVGEYTPTWIKGLYIKNRKDNDTTPEQAPNQSQ